MTTGLPEHFRDCDGTNTPLSMASSGAIRFCTYLLACRPAHSLFTMALQQCVLTCVRTMFCCCCQPLMSVVICVTFLLYRMYELIQNGEADGGTEAVNQLTQLLSGGATRKKSAVSDFLSFCWCVL